MTKPAIIRFDADAPLEVWPDFPESEISSGTRASIGHRWIDDKSTGLSAGVWEAEANLGRWMKWPVHEFMVIVEGEVVMVEEDRETMIGPGECFFIPKGRRCIWNQSGYAKKFMVIFDDLSGAPVNGSQLIMKIEPGIDNRQIFEDATGQFTIGVSKTTGVERELVVSPCHEVSHLLEGNVTLTDEQGSSQTFKQGDTFFVPIGARAAWKSEGPLGLIFCRLQPREKA